jgi:hypothetical protein
LLFSLQDRVRRFGGQMTPLGSTSKSTPTCSHLKHRPSCATCASMAPKQE